MPAFDPVRDAALSSPTTLPSQAQPLLPKTHPAAVDHPPKHLSPPPGPDGRPSPALSSTTTTTPTPVPHPPQRRATDLSVLLNSHSVDPVLHVRTPTTATQSPTTLTPRSSISHLLLSQDIPVQLTSPISRREPSEAREASYFAQRPPSQGSTASSHTLFGSNSSPSGISPSPAAGPSRASHSASTTSPLTLTVAPPPIPSSSSSSPNSQTARLTRSPIETKPIMPPKKKSTIPYNPRTRVTPPGSVLKPMTAGEVDMYRTFVGHGTQRLMTRKRKRPVDDDGGGWGGGEDQLPDKKWAGDVGVVVEHYNARPDVGLKDRQESPIIGLKNFNNWVKSVLISKFAYPVLGDRESYKGTTQAGSGRRGGSGKVLDMGCGKGGDLNKWSKARVREVCCVDIAEVSVTQARARWETMKGARFDAHFAALDCYTDLLTKAFSPAQLAAPFDVVSMQFCMHYAFETVQKARRMLENVTKWLRPGGIFVGTIPNSEQLLTNLDSLPPDRDKNNLSFGNSVYKIRFEDRDKKPVFGHKYWFYLQDAVENVPEYVVRWDNFLQMASEYGLECVYREEFHHVFNEHGDDPEFRSLMLRMGVVDADGGSAMDEDQWEAANIYIAFAFKKIS